ncbi:anaphase-promoting complex subunit 4 [Dermacentor variabilis]|uniref:anaphase-promoting complex subunit 4 n=1 Tax=Dermacentor variabilis TaxID=34621 RepID=UPI003F5BEC35
MASFRQVNERHVSAEVELMLWSPRLDLIALALKQGDVALHRLSWKRVWLRTPPGDKEHDVAVLSLAWRPDGKILAIGYSTGTIILCNVENSDIVHTLTLSCGVTCLCWSSDGTTAEDTELQSRILYRDFSSAYLPKLPSLNKSYGCTSSAKSVEENVDDCKMLKGQEDFNILVVGLANGSVSLYAYGVLLCLDFEVTLADRTGEHTKRVISAWLSDHFSKLTVVVESERDGAGRCMYLHVYNVPQLREKRGELRMVALKYGQIASLATYLTSTMSSIKEAWEDILLEVDSKLANYAQEKRRTSSGTVSDDFLELLMFGTPSDALEKFLVHDLTEKGLKKLGHSIELCYSNVQKYVLKQLQGVTQAVYFHLADLQGMALWEDRFGALGLRSAAVTNALGCTGSFLLKLAELLQVIEVSIRNFKAFFRWLYVVILRLSDDSVPPEVTRISQQEIVFVAEFLKENFAVEWSEENRLSFSLERVGQYLKDEPLVFPLPAHLNAWLKFLEQNPAVLNLAIPHHSKSSLVQEHKQLDRAATDAFVGLTDALRPSVSMEAQVALATMTHPERLSVLSHVTSSKDDCIYTSFVPCRTTGQDLYLVKHVTATGEFFVARLYFEKFRHIADGSDAKCYVVLDAQFYNEDVLSVLMCKDGEHTDSNVPLLVQLGLKHVQNYFKPLQRCVPHHVILVEMGIQPTDAANCLEKMDFRRLEKMRAASFAVSGARNVVCVLFHSRRRVRTFEMDVEEEDDETGDEDEEDKDAKFTAEKDITDFQDDDKENSF